MDWMYLVVVGLSLDVVGFVMVYRHGISTSIWAGSVSELTGIPGTPEEEEEERLENEAILRRRRYARCGAYAVGLGFVLQLIGVIGSLVTE